MKLTQLKQNHNEQLSVSCPKETSKKRLWGLLVQGHVQGKHQNIEYGQRKTKERAVITITEDK